MITMRKPARGRGGRDDAGIGRLYYSCECTPSYLARTCIAAQARSQQAQRPHTIGEHQDPGAPCDGVPHVAVDVQER